MNVRLTSLVFGWAVRLDGKLRSGDRFSKPVDAAVDSSANRRYDKTSWNVKVNSRRDRKEGACRGRCATVNWEEGEEGWSWVERSVSQKPSLFEVSQSSSSSRARVNNVND